MARATSSLPVPVSPCTSTVKLDSATWPTCWITWAIAGLPPMRSLSELPCPWRFSSSMRERSWLRSTARSSVRVSSSTSNGLVR